MFRYEKYCRICGKEKSQRKEISYNGKTGEKIITDYYDECEIEDCQHGHHKFGWTKCKNCEVTR